MNIIFYENLSDRRYVTKQLTEVTTSEIILLDDNNVVNPYVIIKMIENYNDMNYAYIENLGRYYYISGFTVLTGKRLKIDLKCDVLMSFADDIKTSTAIIKRANSVGNPLISDSQQLYRADDIITNLAFSGCEFLRGVSTVNYSFLLSCFGGANSGQV